VTPAAIAIPGIDNGFIEIKYAPGVIQNWNHYIRRLRGITPIQLEFGQEMVRSEHEKHIYK
jgi:hypothetical protein